MTVPTCARCKRITPAELAKLPDAPLEPRRLRSVTVDEAQHPHFSQNGLPTSEATGGNS